MPQLFSNARDREGELSEYRSLPIGSVVTVNAGDYSLMGDMCRFGFTPTRYYPGNLADMRRDFLRLFSRDKWLAQFESAPAKRGAWTVPQWLVATLAILAIVLFSKSAQ